MKIRMRRDVGKIRRRNDIFAIIPSPAIVDVKPGNAQGVELVPHNGIKYTVR